MKQNHSSSFFLSYLALFHFSPAGKKANKSSFICFRENKDIMLQTLRGNKSIKLQILALKKIKLSRLLLQRNNEFKMNEIQRKTPQ